MLDEEGHMTLFAPTNAAFKKLDKKVLDKLTNEEDECAQSKYRRGNLINIYFIDKTNYWKIFYI